MLIEPPLIIQFAFRRSRRRRWLKEPVRERTNAPQDHGADRRIGEQAGDQPDGIAGDHVAVGINRVVEISVLRVPDTTMREVEVPRQDRPFAAAPGIAVDIPVFHVQIDVPDYRVGGEHVDAPRNVDVVVEVLGKGGASQVQAIDERLEVVVIFKYASLFFHAGGSGVSGIFVQEVRVNFVERAVLVQPGAFEVNIVRVFDEVGRAEKIPVLFDAHGVGKVRGHARLAHYFVGQHVAHFRFVRPIGEQIDVGHARGVRAPAEALSAIEIDVVALLWEAGGGLPVQTEQHVVVKLAIIINRAAGPGFGARSTGVAGKPVEHRQSGSHAGVLRYRAKILMRVERITVGRLSCFGALAVRGDESPPRHFPRRKRRGWNDRRPDAIARHRVAAGAIVTHRHHGLGGKHPPVVKLHGRHGVVGRTNLRGNGQRTGHRLGRVFYRRTKDRTGARAAGIRSTGSGRGEKAPRWSRVGIAARFDIQGYGRLARRVGVPIHVHWLAGIENHDLAALRQFRLIDPLLHERSNIPRGNRRLPAHRVECRHGWVTRIIIHHVTPAESASHRVDPMPRIRHRKNPQHRIHRWRSNERRTDRAAPGERRGVHHGTRRELPQPAREVEPQVSLAVGDADAEIEVVRVCVLARAARARDVNICVVAGMTPHRGETDAAGRSGLAETKRYVLELRRVGGCEAADDRHTVRRHQRQVLPVRRELEIRMEPARRINAIFS